MLLRQVRPAYRQLNPLLQVQVLTAQVGSAPTPLSGSRATTGSPNTPKKYRPTTLALQQELGLTPGPIRKSPQDVTQASKVSAVKRGHLATASAPCVLFQGSPTAPHAEDSPGAARGCSAKRNVRLVSGAPVTTAQTCRVSVAAIDKAISPTPFLAGVAARVDLEMAQIPRGAQCPGSIGVMDEGTTVQGFGMPPQAVNTNVPQMMNHTCDAGPSSSANARGAMNPEGLVNGRACEVLEAAEIAQEGPPCHSPAPARGLNLRLFPTQSQEMFTERGDGLPLLALPFSMLVGQTVDLEPVLPAGAGDTPPLVPLSAISPGENQGGFPGSIASTLLGTMSLLATLPPTQCEDLEGGSTSPAASPARTIIEDGIGISPGALLDDVISRDTQMIHTFTKGMLNPRRNLSHCLADVCLNAMPDRKSYERSDLNTLHPFKTDFYLLLTLVNC